MLEAENADLALHLAYDALANVAVMRAQNDAAVRAYERAAMHARRAGLSYESLGWRAIFRFYGTSSVSELLAWLDENEPPEGGDYLLRASRAWAFAMLGRFDDARAILAESRSELAERGGGIQLGVITGIESAGVELLADDPAAAAALGREGCRLLEELGDLSFLSTAAAVLADALYELDRFEDSDDWARRAAAIGASDDVPTQMLWRQVRAKVLARRKEYVEAERLAREAVAIGEETHFLNGQGDAHADLAEVLLLAGKREEADTALKEALGRYERKENRVSASHVLARLTDLSDSN